MYLPPWLAASLAALNIASSPSPHVGNPLVGSDVAEGLARPDPVYMVAQSEDGDRFMSVSKVKEGAAAQLVKASNTSPTAWVWLPRTNSRPDHVRIHVNGSDPALCLAAPVDANKTPMAGDLVLVPCHQDTDLTEPHIAGGPSRDPSLWTQAPEPGGTISFHLPKGLFLGFRGNLVGCTNNYEWSNAWIGMRAA